MQQNLQTIIVHIMYGKSISLRNHSLQTAEIASMLVFRLLNASVDVGCFLDKPESLTVRETEIMQLHTSWGLQFVESVGLGRYSHVVSQHHENASGTGYPLGLLGNDLDQLTRVVRIADLLSALLEDRPYRRGIVDDHFILTNMEQDLEGLFNGSSAIIRRAIVDYMDGFRRQKKSIPEVLRISRDVANENMISLERTHI